MKPPILFLVLVFVLIAAPNVFGYDFFREGTNLHYRINISELPVYDVEFSWELNLSANTTYVASKTGDYVFFYGDSIIGPFESKPPYPYNFSTFFNISKNFTLAGNYSGKVFFARENSTNTSHRLVFNYTFEIIRNISVDPADPWVMTDLSSFYRLVCDYELPLNFSHDIVLRGNNFSVFNISSDHSWAKVINKTILDSSGTSVVPVNFSFPSNSPLGERDITISFVSDGVSTESIFTIEVVHCVIPITEYEEYVRSCSNVTTEAQKIRCKAMELAYEHALLDERRKLINYTDSPRIEYVERNTTTVEYRDVCSLTGSAVSTLTQAAELSKQLSSCEARVSDWQDKVSSLASKNTECVANLSMVPSLLDAQRREQRDRDRLLSESEEAKRNSRKNWIIFFSVIGFIFGGIFFVNQRVMI